MDWRCQALLAQLARSTGDTATATAERAREEARGGVDAIARGIDDEGQRPRFKRMARRALLPGRAGPAAPV